MIIKKTIKIGKERFLEYVDDDTGMVVNKVPLDETEYKHKTAEALTDGHMRINPGITYGEAFSKVSAKYPEFFI